MSDIQLPPLPEYSMSRRPMSIRYDDGQMQAYARLAVEQDRTARAVQPTEPVAFLKLADDLMEKVARGRKTTTIRQGRRDIRIGPLLLEATGGTVPPIPVIVDRAEVTLLYNAPMWALADGGYRDHHALRDTLRRFYPDIQDNSEITSIRFALAHPPVQPTEPLDERAGFEAWVEEYALRYEPNYAKLLEIDCNFAFKAGIDFARAYPPVQPTEPRTQYGDRFEDYPEAMTPVQPTEPASKQWIKEAMRLAYEMAGSYQDRYDGPLAEGQGAAALEAHLTQWAQQLEPVKPATFDRLKPLLTRIRTV